MQNDYNYQGGYVDNVENGDDFNLRELIEKYAYHSKWFALGLFIASLGAFAYLRYTPNTYKVDTRILIDDKENGGGMNSELSAFKDLGILGDSKTTLDTEMSVLKSRTLMQRTVKELGINITYFKVGKVRDVELYGEDIPIKINFLMNDFMIKELDTVFTIKAVSATNFMLYDANGRLVGEQVFGEKVFNNFGDMVITPVNLDHSIFKKEVRVQISPVEEVANYYLEEIQIAPDTKKSSVLVLSLEDILKYKAQDILNNLVAQYNKDAIDDKLLIAQNTEDFINNRIEDISIELTNVDIGVETYKTANKLTDIDYEVGLVLESNSELERNIVDLTSQIKLIDYVQNYMKIHTNDLIPANLGLKDETASQSTLIYNQLLLERNRILKGSSTMNPTVINLDAQINTLKASIDQSLVNLRRSLTLSLNEARLQENRISSKRALAPKQEREFQDIKRKQQIVETLYLYLLEKREENAITLAVTAPNAKIIDQAAGSKIPIHPRPLLIYLIAAISGLIIPLIIIYLGMIIDNKVHTIKEVENELSAPVLGDIPSTKSDDKIIVTEKDTSNVGEAFRLLRTNIEFMLPMNKEDGKRVFITSTIGGEGKSFVAINLAHAMSLINKKVLLIESDIRKPKISKYLCIEPKYGLTNYLIDDKLEVPDVITSINGNRLDVITSGPIPPNPSELLTNGRFGEIIAYGEEYYDYVIVDTSPISIVTDTLLLGRLADLVIYVVRANYLDKRLLSVPNKLFENNRLPNMAILLNDTNHRKKGYGYAYGYKEEERVWWKFG